MIIKTNEKKPRQLFLNIGEPTNGIDPIDHVGQQRFLRRLIKKVVNDRSAILETIVVTMRYQPDYSPCSETFIK